jgi:hypothetical protein
MELQVEVVNSKAFTHHPATKRLVAEISDIQLGGFDRLYDDAADVGFALRNPKTGNVTRWSLADEVRTGGADNELLGWYFKPTPESLYKNPALAGYCMTLIND